MALSEIERVAERAPLAEGVKLTTMVQLAPAAREVPQVLFCTKSVELAPVTARAEIASETEPVLVSVTVWAELVMSTGSLAKARLEGERVAVGEVLTPAAGETDGLGAAGGAVGNAERSAAGSRR